jgi:uncharacterized protein YqgV (UPF0045/DUF77 family)
MQVTVEVSLYPLTENFEAVVIEYIEEIKKTSSLQIFVNGLSTQIIGEYDLVMSTLNKINKETFEKYKCVILMKMASGEKTIDNLPEVLK